MAKKKVETITETPPAQLTRQREKPSPKLVVAPIKPQTVEEIKPEVIQDSRPKKPSTDKYVRYCEDTNQEEKKIFADKVHKGELAYGYYAIDNDKGYHYFLIIKK